jgi:predicted O-methyltransferase YrrM
MITQFDNDIITNELAEGAILNTGFPGFVIDYLVLHCLIRKYQPTFFLEIGTNTGVGTNIICNAGKLWGMEVTSLELSPVMAEKSKQYPSAERIGSACKRKFVQLLGDSIELDYEGYEAAYIDGEHDYQHPLFEGLSCVGANFDLIIYHDADIPEVEMAIKDTFINNNDYDVYRIENTRIAYAKRK